MSIDDSVSSVIAHLPAPEAAVGSVVASSTSSNIAGAVLSAVPQGSLGGVLGSQSTDGCSAAGVAPSAPKIDSLGGALGQSEAAGTALNVHQVSSLGNVLSPAHAGDHEAAGIASSVPRMSSLDGVLDDLSPRASNNRSRSVVESPAPQGVARVDAALVPVGLDAVAAAFAAAMSQVMATLESQVRAVAASQTARMAAEVADQKARMAELQAIARGVRDVTNAVRGKDVSVSRAGECAVVKGTVDVSDVRSTAEKGRRKVHRQSKSEMVKALRKAEASVTERLANVKANIAVDEGMVECVEACMSKKHGFTRRECQNVMQILVNLEDKINFGRETIKPKIKSLLKRIRKCVAAMNGSGNGDEERQEEVWQEHLALVKRVDAAEWRMSGQCPRGCSAREIRAQINALPQRVSSVVWRKVERRQLINEGSEWAANVRSSVAGARGAVNGASDASDRDEDDVERECERKSTFKSHKKHVKHKENEWQAQDADVDAATPRKNALRAAELKARALAKNVKFSPMVAAVLNDSISAEREETLDEDAGWWNASGNIGCDIVAQEQSAAHDGTTRATGNDGNTQRVAYGDGDPPDDDGDDSSSNSDGGSDVDAASSDSDALDSDGDAPGRGDNGAGDNKKKNRHERRLEALKQRKQGKKRRKHANGALAMRKQSIKLDKVLANVKPDEQFIFDETKVPQMNIIDSFRDFDGKLKHQMEVATFGKNVANIEINDSILINHFVAWLKSNALRDAWKDPNLGKSYAVRKKMFCKSYGLTRFMINTELSNCKSDGKEDLLAFSARLSAVETRYCEANRTSLDENTLVNHFVERIKCIPALYGYATAYVQSENNQQRDVTRAELVRQVHLKHQVRQESKARREREKAANGCEKTLEVNEKVSNVSEEKENHVVEALSQLAAQVNAIVKRENVMVRGNERVKFVKCFFCEGPHEQSVLAMK